MVNNSTTINKMDNHFSLNTKRPRHMALEIHILAWDRHTLLKCDRQISIATRIIFFLKFIVYIVPMHDQTRVIRNKCDIYVYVFTTVIYTPILFTPGALPPFFFVFAHAQLLIPSLSRSVSTFLLQR